MKRPFLCFDRLFDSILFVPGYYHHFGIACRETGRYEEGIASLKKCLQLAPNDVIARIVLVSLYMYAGREDEARATVAEIHDRPQSLCRKVRQMDSMEGRAEEGSLPRLSAPGGAEVKTAASFCSP